MNKIFEDAFIASLTQQMTEFFRRQQSSAVKNGMRAAAMECRYTGGNVPYGYGIDPESKRFTIDESEADIIRQIFELASQRYGYAEILSYLAAQSVKTRRGNEFTVRGLQRILRNQQYAGIYIYKGTGGAIVIPGGMPAIVNADLFEAVQCILSQK